MRLVLRGAPFTTGACDGLLPNILSKRLCSDFVVPLLTAASGARLPTV